jgi:germination protein M
MAEKKKKQASLGCLFWIAFILLVLVLFFFNKQAIMGGISKISSSGFLSGKNRTELDGNSTAPIQPAISADSDVTIVPGTTDRKGDGSLEPAPTPTASDEGKPAGKTGDAIKTSADAKPDVKTEKKPEAKQTATKPVAPTEKKPTAAATNPTTNPAPEKTIPTRRAKLFFVTIDAEGKVLRREVSRDIPQNDSTLSETLQTLFRGANADERAKGLRSLVPPGTRLLSATVKNGVATVNLSEEFQFNQFGIEGYIGQLAQIVFTATSYPTVKSVQILIDGQRREYLGAEGVWIGTPLSRDKFQ